MVYLHDKLTGVSEEIIANTPNGLIHGFRPTVPFPKITGVFFKRYVCDCGRRFTKFEDYAAHYIYKAVWDNESGYIPQEIAKAITNKENK